MAGLLDDALDGGAAYGFFPQINKYRKFNDRESSANMPVQGVLGTTAATGGVISDLLSLFQSPKGNEMMGDVSYEPNINLPYGTQDLSRMLPLQPTTPNERFARGLGEMIPLNPTPALKALGKVGEFAVRGGGEMLNAAMMGENQGLLGKIVPQPKFLDVYHGSPHRFPPTERNLLGEFDANKIGTGEGAQAYGHGLYLAEAPMVAKGYQLALAPEKNVTSLTDKAKFVRVGDKSINPDTFDVDISQELIDAAKLGKNEFINFANQRKSRWQELANDESYKFRTYAQDKLSEYNNLIKEADKSGVTYTGGGNLYKVDLPDAMIPKMLDYEKHLSEQSDQVQKILLPYQKEIGSSFGTGEQILKELAFDRKMKGLDYSPSAVSKQLQEMGIPGIKYLDEKSRGLKYLGDSAYLHASNSFKDSGYTFDQALKGMKQAYKTANEKELKDALDAVYAPKTQNFVVFPGEEKRMKILKRN